MSDNSKPAWVSFQPQDTEPIIERVASRFEGNISMALRYMVRHFGTCPFAKSDDYGAMAEHPETVSLPS